MIRRLALMIALLALAPGQGARALEAATEHEVPSLAAQVANGDLPALGDRLPNHPLVADFAAEGRSLGRYGGEFRMIAAKVQDLRYVGVLGYARLVAYDANLHLRPDILEAVEDEDDRVFTFTLREGHRWSDGAPFTTEDFRYYWEDIANNPELNPSGPPEVFRVDGELPRVEILSPTRIRFSWSKPNPVFLPTLALPRPVFIYAPSHYLRRFHARYGDRDKIAAEASRRGLSSWAALHNKLDAAYETTNVDMPTLNPWKLVTAPPGHRFVFERNAYFHRVDPVGRQLPYVDRVVVSIVAPGLFAAQANAGAVDLQARGLSMADVPVLREGEALHGYRTLLWPMTQGSAFALYPNLTTSDPVWRQVLRDVRFRRALSLAIDRHTLNNALWFGLAREGNNAMAPSSPLYREADHSRWANYDPAEANRLLDEMGLGTRDSSGTRLLPDGRPLRVIVDVEGKAAVLIDALEITQEFWADVGIRLFIKPGDIANIRQRSYAGQTVMVAATGFDNALATPGMMPQEICPVEQVNYAWPKWGQYHETGGKLGEAPDMPGAQRLMALYEDWRHSGDMAGKAEAWTEMLALHADNQWVIGTVSGDLQPIVVNARLRNVPGRANFSWAPTALLGAYHVDEFYYADGE